MNNVNTLLVWQHAVVIMSGHVLNSLGGNDCLIRFSGTSNHKHGVILPNLGGSQSQIFMHIN